MQAEIGKKIELKTKTLFRQARLIDLETGNFTSCDILVAGNKIEQISNHIEESDCEIVDLKGNYVLPSFYNAYSDGLQSISLVYQKELEKQNQKDYIFNYFYIKNLLSGVGKTCDVSLFERDLNYKILEHIEDLSEQELEEISILAHKNKTKLYIKVGQTLEELGTIDKLYGKPVSQVLEDFGLLEDAPTIIGGNCLEKYELELLKNYDCKFVLTPFEDGKEGRRPTNLNALRNLDFEVSIGSGLATEIDFFAYIRQLLMNTRSMFEDKEILTEQEVLKIATNQKTSLEVGEGADFMVLASDESLYDDIFKTFVWEKSKKDVIMTVVGGKIAQHNGKININEKFVDVDSIKKELNTMLRRI